MSALQECSNTPLLLSSSSKPNMVSPINFKSTESAILSSEPPLPSYSEQCCKNSFAENELFSYTSELLPGNSLCNFSPPPYNESHQMSSNNRFLVGKSCQTTFTELPGEIDHLLCDEFADRSSFVPESDHAPHPCNKKALSIRSASDYSLSRKYEDGRSIAAVNCDPKRSSKSSIHPLAEVQLSELGTDSANNCTCFILPEVYNTDGSGPSCKRHSLPTDCEATGSGLYQNNLDSSSDEKNYYKPYNLNSTVFDKIYDTESLSESGEQSGLAAELNNQRIMDESWFISSSRHAFSSAELSGSASAAQLSIASSFGDSNTPTCKICHMPAKTDDPLISPCRCTGTLHYIHCGCLMRWLEICNKRSRKPPACELCKYQFHWHKKFKVRHWQFPNCSWRDKVLHTVFLISILVMIGCAIVTVMCFRQHRGNKPDLTHLELTQSEIITLICGALFFLAFFLAMYVEIKARNTIYKLLVKFIYLNQQWYIDEYDKKGENTVIDV